jgi:hypothetical protein
MKTKKKNGRCIYLQTRNKRWKWMAGATAATAAGVTASQAGLVTINLTNNYLSATEGNHLNADLSGDGHPDLTITGAKYSAFRTPTQYFSVDVRFVSVLLNGVLAKVYSKTGFFRTYSAQLGSRRGISRGSGTYYLSGSIPIFFKDLHINGGAPTEGSLEATVSIGGKVEIQLDSFTYTSNTPVAGSRIAAVPDQGSTLALLAMGAGGVLALRRFRAKTATEQ